MLDLTEFFAKSSNRTPNQLLWWAIVETLWLFAFRSTFLWSSLPRSQMITVLLTLWLTLLLTHCDYHLDELRIALLSLLSPFNVLTRFERPWKSSTGWLSSKLPSRLEDCYPAGSWVEDSWDRKTFSNLKSPNRSTFSSDPPKQQKSLDKNSKKNAKQTHQENLLINVFCRIRQIALRWSFYWRILADASKAKRPLNKAKG